MTLTYKRSTALLMLNIEESIKNLEEKLGRKLTEVELNVVKSFGGMMNSVWLDGQPKKNDESFSTEKAE